MRSTTAAFVLSTMALVTAAPANAQEKGGGSAAALRVFLECGGCDASSIRREIVYVNWVRDRGDADLHLLGTARAVGTGGVRYELTFTGLGRFAGRADTLRHRASATETPQERDAGLIQIIQLGLVRYVAATPQARNLRVSFVPASPGAATRRREALSEPARAQRSASQQRRWAAALDLGFTSSSGNSELIALTTGVRVRHLQTRLFRLDWSASFRYGESRGEVVARYVHSKLDFDMGPDARLAPFISAAGERDPFRRLELRSKVGTGIRYRLYDGERGEASLRAAVLYSHERFTPEADRPGRTDGAWSLEFKGHRRLGESVRIENTSNYDPVMGDLGDFILDVKSKLSTGITHRLALTLGHAYSYDSRPVRDVRRADQRFQAGLTMHF